MKTTWIAAAVMASVLFGGHLSAAEVNILSAGAIEPGLRAAADLFRKETGTEVVIKFATAPVIRQRVGSGESADVVLAPPAVIDELVKAGKLNAEGRVGVGRVGVGVAVRNGAPAPDISTSAAFKQAVLGAESIVYNQASTGAYVDQLLQRLGIAEDVKAKTKRYPDGDGVMAHLLKGTGKEFGFGAITEIMLYGDKGLRLVGPLPADIQNYTSYAGAAFVTPANPDAAAKFVAFLRGPDSKRAFASKGIEQVD